MEVSCVFIFLLRKMSSVEVNTVFCHVTFMDWMNNYSEIAKISMKCLLEASMKFEIIETTTEFEFMTT